MAKTGGYQIIDLKNNDLLSLSSLAGIYDAIEGNYRKAILLSGIVISGVEKTDIFTIPEVSGSSFVLRNVYGYDVTIADDDSISVASTQWVTRAYVDGKIDGIKTYYHPIYVFDNANLTMMFTCAIINSSPTAFTFDTFKAFLEGGANFTLGPVSGYVKAGDTTILISRIFFDNTNNIVYSYGVTTAGVVSNAENITAIWNAISSPSFTDNVNEIH